MLIILLINIETQKLNLEHIIVRFDDLDSFNKNKNRNKYKFNSNKNYI